MYDTF